MTAVPVSAPGRLRKVAVDQITVDFETQSRDHINPSVAHRYGLLMIDGEWDFARSTEPVVLFHDGTRHWIGDGFHRVIGAQNHGVKHLLCEVRNGTARDALWFSFSANALHGYRREPSDVKHILNRILGDPEWSRKGVREIAEHTGISKSSVQRYREIYLSQVGQMPSEVRHVERNGKSYEMVVGSIGKAPGPEPAPQWRQSDIEDFTAKPAPRCDPSHASPAGRIAYLLTELRAHTTLTPREFLAATSWSLEDEIRPAVRGNLEWIQELMEILDERR
jgi:hypothetical protein